MKRIAAILLCTIMLLTGCSLKELSFIGKSPFAGRTVRVAVIDTGFSSVAIPEENIGEGANYLFPENTTEDTYGHGTAVASVILNHAENVLLIPLVSNVYTKGKISFVDNQTFAQMIIDAVDVYDCEIINISAGLVLDKEVICNAIVYAEEQGVLVVASAGNDYVENPGQIYYPAAYETVLAVGSLTADGTEIAEFSQRGEWVDLFAPGEKIQILTLSGGTSVEKGSSYAAAQITAAAVRYLQKNENLTTEKLRNILKEEAASYGAMTAADAVLTVDAD